VRYGNREQQIAQYQRLGTLAGINPVLNADGTLSARGNAAFRAWIRDKENGITHDGTGYKGHLNLNLKGLGKPGKPEGEVGHHPYIGNDPTFSEIPSFPAGRMGDEQRKEWVMKHPQPNKRSEQAIQVLFLADAHDIPRGQIMITKNYGALSQRFDKTIPTGPTAGSPVLNKELMQKSGITGDSVGCYGLHFEGVRKRGRS